MAPKVCSLLEQRHCICCKGIQKHYLNVNFLERNASRFKTSEDQKRVTVYTHSSGTKVAPNPTKQYFVNVQEFAVRNHSSTKQYYYISSFHVRQFEAWDFVEGSIDSDFIVQH
jgi:hypothetical protein